MGFRTTYTHIPLRFPASTRANWENERKRQKRENNRIHLLHTVGVHSTRRTRKKFYFEWHRARTIRLLAIFILMAWHPNTLHVSSKQLKLTSIPMTMGASEFQRMLLEHRASMLGTSQEIPSLRCVQFHSMIVQNVGDNRNKCHY